MGQQLTDFRTIFGRKRLGVGQVDHVHRRTSLHARFHASGPLHPASVAQQPSPSPSRPGLVALLLQDTDPGGRVTVDTPLAQFGK
jgi:hypothetical protein